MKIIGTGLNCIDIVHKNNKTILMNGGTCANVLTVLAQLGWKSNVLIPEYISDPLRDLFTSNFKQLGVEINEYCKTNIAIPRIIEEYDAKGHVFYTKCPLCGKELVTKRQITHSESQKTFFSKDDADIFFFDRISSGVKNYIKLFRQQKKDVIIMYEPNSGRNISSIINFTAEVDILKFSSDKISFAMAEKIKQQCSDKNLKLMIFTKGKEGMSFCFKQNDGTFSVWYEGPHKEFVNIKDASGAGDWLSAGLLYYMFKKKIDLSFLNNYECIYNSLCKALNLSSIQVQTEGAQGIFYSQELLQSMNCVEKCLNKKSLSIREIDFSHSYCERCLI